MPAKIEYPTVRQRLLARALRELDAASGKTRAEVAREAGITASALWRIMEGERVPRAGTLDALLNAYAVPAPRRPELVALRRRAHEPDAIHVYHENVPAAYQAYTDFEQAACRIDTWQPAFIPGLLQTEEYTRAIHAVGDEMPREEVESRVALRKRRQRTWGRSDPPAVRAVIDESVLLRVVGDPFVMARQLDRLLSMQAELDDISIQVVPFVAGAHSAMDGSVVLLDFPSAMDSSVAYMEGPGGWTLSEQSADVARYRRLFDNVRSVALSVGGSEALIRHTRRGYSEHPEGSV